MYIGALDKYIVYELFIKSIDDNVFFIWQMFLDLDRS